MRVSSRADIVAVGKGDGVYGGLKGFGGGWEGRLRVR